MKQKTRKRLQTKRLTNTEERLQTMFTTNDGVEVARILHELLQKGAITVKLAVDNCQIVQVIFSKKRDKNRGGG